METTFEHPALCLFSVEQIKALERIARENHATPSTLVSLAVDALIVEADRHDGWLPLPDAKPKP